MPSFEIDPDIRRARSLPGAAYRDPACWEAQRRRILARSWQLVDLVEPPDGPGVATPWTFLPGAVDEPLVLTRDAEGREHLLSNVCTHRGNLVARAAERCRQLRCGYHGRRFGLDGRVLSMPEFDGVEGFPAPEDDLARLPLERLGPFRFAALDPAFRFAEWIAPARERLEPLPLPSARFDSAGSRDYDVPAHWALYCDNYLEGFHIPYVHEGLAAALDYGAYRVETFPLGVLQVGIAAPGEDAFELPPDHPDHGTAVAGLYLWLFPNLMLNAYPWGISVNVVLPIGPDRTRVRFLSWVWDAERRDRGAGADLDRVELEDEAVVRSAQRGMRSRFYRGGRYSPAREAGVHRFHRLLVAFGGVPIAN